MNDEARPDKAKDDTMDTPGMNYETLTGTKNQARVDEKRRPPTKPMSKKQRILLGIIIAVFGPLKVWYCLIGIFNLQIIDAAKDGDTAFIQQRLNQGASPNAAESDTQDSVLNLAASNGHTDTVKLLLDRGADIHSRNTFGFTPLLSAADTGHTDTVKLLLQRGADLNDRTEDGETALSEAFMWRDTQTAKILLHAGAKE